MSTFRGPRKFSCWCALPPLEIALQFTVEAKPFRNARPCRAAGQLELPLRNSTHRQSLSKQQQEIVSSWLLTKFLPVLRRWTASQSSTRYSDGAVQRNPRRAVQPRTAKALRDEGRGPGTPTLF